MVTTRFISLLLCLLLSLVALGDSIAPHAHQAVGSLPSKVDQEFREGARTVAETRSKWLRGRKMGVEEVVKKEVMVVRGAKNTGANPCVGKCDHGGKGKLDSKCELTDRSLPSTVHSVGFMTFSSDYYLARTHPPTNN